MKACPSCNEQPISMLSWLNGVNSIECNCKKCGVTLSASVATWVVIGVIALAMIVSVYLALTEFGFHFKRDRLELIGIIIGVGVVGSVIGYLFSGYKLKNTP